MTRRTGRARSRAMTETPTEIDGMRVLLDRRVTLFPVTLVEPPDAEDAKASAAARPTARRPRSRARPGSNGRHGHRGNGHGHLLA